MLQSAPKHVIFIFKIQNFSGEGAQHSPLPQREGDTPSRTHPPRRLDLRAFSAHLRTPPPHSEVWLRAS